MMRLLVVPFSALACAALVACGGSTATTPVASAPIVVAGEYMGTVSDSAGGAAGGDLVLAQHGANAGGTMTITSGSTSTVESVALTLAGSSLNGSGVMDVNGAACTFAIAANVSNNALTATYSGVSGCANTGSWSLTQTCSGTTASDSRNAQGVIPRC
jgi:hypothetical protein